MQGEHGLVAILLIVLHRQDKTLDPGLQRLADQRLNQRPG